MSDKSISVSAVNDTALIRVVIVEDDEWVGENLARELGESVGFSCLGAFRSAEAAIEGVPSLKPDVVLMDINLPGMDGVQCVQRLKELCPEVQFLMLTQHSRSFTAQRDRREFRNVSNTFSQRWAFSHGRSNSWISKTAGHPVRPAET